MLMVIALGGNALLKKGQPPEAELQKQNIVRAAKSIADVAEDHSLVVTHGNGPQVGLLALQAESYKLIKPYPLDILDAESAGMLGYQLEQQLVNALPGRDIVALLTQVLVDTGDHAFTHPTKAIGPVYDLSEEPKLIERFKWTLTKVDEGVRRVVPSPEPKKILELNAIKLLIDHGVIVVCGGGGGIPVIAGQDGEIEGVPAVIDKDLTSALLATELGADLLLLLTDTDAVYKNWGKTSATPIVSATINELRNQDFETGTMAPKVEAACRFVEYTGANAYIGELTEIADILTGRRGTKITKG